MGLPAAVDVCMPALGESEETGTIVRWLKAPGDAVAVDEPLFEVSSDKATMEVPSLAAGFVHEILAAEGAAAHVGAVIARIAAERAAPEASPSAGGAGTERDRLSPVVRKLLREHGLDAAAVAGSGEGGRITKDDVLAYVAGRGADELPASPPVNAAVGRSRRVPLPTLRRRAGELLAASQKSAVNVFSAIEIDLEAVAAERKRRGYSYLPFIARAAVEALQAYPALNASLDGDAALVMHDDVHLGIAVDLDRNGLVVPVVRHAQRLTLDGLAAEIARVAKGARAAKLPLEAYAGSTFSITNNGAFGTLLTAPVINAPNVAIVSTDAVELRPVVIDRAIAIRHRMYCCMTWDHRAFDGSTAAAFLARLKHNLETWDWTAQ